jgi:sugar lactone lactonase YvrE
MLRARGEVALDDPAAAGVAPAWEQTTGSVVWVDTSAESVHRFRPADGHDHQVPVPQQVGAARPRTNGGLVLNLRDGIGLSDPQGDLRWLVYWRRERAWGHGAAVDPAGRLWAGSGDWLVRVDAGGRAVTVPSVACAGRMDWTAEGTLTYQADPARRRIDVLDYDLTAGEASGRRPLCDPLPSVPAGLCVDAEGGVWVALAAGEVRRYAADGRLDLVVEVPDTEITGCCFGGEALTDLYLTTATGGPLLVLPDLAQGRPTTRFTG